MGHMGHGSRVQWVTWVTLSDPFPALIDRPTAVFRRKNLKRGQQTCIAYVLYICGTAGMMYWGNGFRHKIETANLNGTGRTTLQTAEPSKYVTYCAFVLDAGNIYMTDWTSTYAY